MRLPRLLALASLSVLLLAAPEATHSASPPPPQQDSVDLLLGLIREQGALRRHVERISDPGTNGYRSYLPISKIQRRYGANAQARAAVRSYVAKRGGKVSFDAAGGAAYVQMPRRAAAASFGSGIASSNAHTGNVPAGLRPYVQEVIDNRSPAKLRPQIVEPPVSAKDIHLPPRTGTAAGCAEGLATGGFSPNQIANAHGFTELHRSGIKGQGRTIALIEFGGGVNASDMATFAQCFGLQAPNLQQIPIGVPAPFSASSPAGDEATLDAQVLIGMAPGLKQINMFEGSASSSFYPLLAAALDPRIAGSQRPDAISVSYGFCEPVLQNLAGYQEIRLSRYILLVAAAAGVSVAFSSGDTGSSGCIEGFPGVTQPAVEYAASQPFVTAVGGSSFTLKPDNQIDNQTTWNDTVYGVPPAESGGGGGGSSFLFARPYYQPKPKGEKGRGARKVPDISFYADEVPGWIIYCTGNQGLCGKASGYARVGGTSAAAPTFAAMIALTNQYAAKRGVPRIGFVNPYLYELGGQRSNTLYDITQGTNDIFGVGCCSATRGYDPATGWGSARVHRFVIGAARAWQSSPAG